MKRAAVGLLTCCAAAATLAKAQLEFRCYHGIQQQEAAEFARMLALHYYSFADREKHKKMAAELAAALEAGVCALLKFVHKAALELLRRSPVAHSLRNKASSTDAALTQIC